MKELKLGPDKVLPIIEEFNIVNKPICIIGLFTHHDMYHLYETNTKTYQFKGMDISNGIIIHNGISNLGTHKNYYKTIEYILRFIINGRDDYKIVQFESFQEMKECYYRNHNQIKEK